MVSSFDLVSLVPEDRSLHSIACALPEKVSSSSFA